VFVSLQVITDKRLILVIAVFLGVDMVILALWQVIDPPQSRPVKVLVQVINKRNTMLCIDAGNLKIEI